MNNAKQIRITATITVDVHVSNPDTILQVAQYRQRDLQDWFKRHMKDIENEMASCDDVQFAIAMKHTEEDKKGEKEEA